MKKITIVLAMALSFSAMATDYTCSGTEPFWSLKLTSKTIEFSSPMDDSTVTEQVASKTNAHGLADEFAFVVKTEQGSVASVVTGECNDGMSDNIYSKHIIYTTGDTVLYGCCDEIK